MYSVDPPKKILIEKHLHFLININYAIFPDASNTHTRVWPPRLPEIHTVFFPTNFTSIYQILSISEVEKQYNQEN